MPSMIAQPRTLGNGKNLKGAEITDGARGVSTTSSGRRYLKEVDVPIITPTIT